MPFKVIVYEDDEPDREVENACGKILADADD